MMRLRRSKQKMNATEALGLYQALLKRFGRDESGSLVLFGMFIFILMLWSLGIGIDIVRNETNRVNLQNTLDRAVLAATDLSQTEDPKTVVKDYFAKANLSQYLATTEVDPPTSDGILNYRRVDATANARVDTLFMNMLGVEYMNAYAASSAEEGISDIEISLVVDVSGSMGDSSSSGKTKLFELQDAAKEFGWMMLCNPNAPVNSSGNCSVEPGVVSISLIPYAEQVVVGESLLDAIDNVGIAEGETPNTIYDVTSEHRSSHCVDFQAEDFIQYDLSATELVDRTGHFDPWRGADSTPGAWTCRTEDWRIIRPFVGHHSNLNHLINNLSASGNTSIDLGMKWGVSLLNPEMNRVIASLATEDRTGGATATEPDFADRPLDAATTKGLKVVVLMTDGVNTSQHYLKQEFRSGPSPIWRYVDKSNKDFYSIYRASTDEYYFTGDGKWYDEPYGKGLSYEYTTTTTTCSRGRWWRGRTCTTTTTTSTETVTEGSIAVQMVYPEVWQQFTTAWYAGWSWLSDPVLDHGGSVKNERLLNICDVARDNSILVYTVGFETTSSSEAILKNCATTAGHFYEADGSSLTDVFTSIARSINKLRLIN
jgi:Flp pilus assembly protein TadG